MLLTIGPLLMSQSGIAEEKWYTPVDIGQHVDSRGMNLEKLSKTDVKKMFQKETILQPEALKRYEKIKDKWFEDNGAAYLKRFKNDTTFSIYRSDHSISASIYEFSKLKAKIYITFIYGHSRWHEYSIVLGNFLAERDPYLDEVFNLKEMEKKYSYSFKGVTHGISAEEVEKILGNNYFEYAGQSPQYRNIYYEQYNLEIIIQDNIVKYLHESKPGWMDTEMKFKK